MEKKMGVRNVVSEHIDAASPKAGDGRARYSRDLRHEVYSLVIESARRLRPDLEIALCLEEQALWERTGLVGKHRAVQLQIVDVRKTRPQLNEALCAEKLA